MSVAVIELVGEDILCSLAGGGNTRLPIAAAQQRLADWASRYDRAAERNLDRDLLAIGLEMFDWLDGSGWASAWANGSGRPDSRDHGRKRRRCQRGCAARRALGASGASGRAAGPRPHPDLHRRAPHRRPETAALPCRVTPTCK